MNRRTGLSIVASVALLLSFGGSTGGQAQQSEISFFVTSAGPGRGGDLGGLNGADQLCQLLGAAAGAGTKTWRAYLSTQGSGAVNARDRIGRGPWLNAKGINIAQDLAELHGQTSINKQTPLTAKGAQADGRPRQRARRPAEHARHPHGIPARRHSVLAERGSHLRQLDEERRGRGDGRSSRPAGATRRRRVEVLELVASLAWAGRGLQSERSEEHRRPRPLLLLRR